MDDNRDKDRDYQRAARLLGSKLGLDWRTLPREQVEEYLRKLEIAGQARLTQKTRRKKGDETP
jgi:hypothetical protein